MTSGQYILGTSHPHLIPERKKSSCPNKAYQLTIYFTLIRVKYACNVKCVVHSNGLKEMYQL